VVKPLHLMVYDATWVGRPYLQAGLTSSWIVGGRLARAMGRLDAVYGAHSFEDALAWLCSVEPKRKIGQIQYWGHGRWGQLFIAKEMLDRQALMPGHAHHESLAALRDRIVGPEALFWFRTCETFGRKEGHDFALAWTRFFRCRAAGHTYVIGPWQSGLHSLAHDAEPTWPLEEGLPPGAKDPRVALTSSASAPHTITCLHGAVPDGW